MPLHPAKGGKETHEGERVQIERVVDVLAQGKNLQTDDIQNKIFSFSLL